MDLHETIPTRQQLYEFARVNRSTTMATLYEDKPFQFVVDGDRLHFIPSSGKSRKVDSGNVDRLLQTLAITRSLKPAHYQDGSYNASYLLPLVLAWQAGGIKAYEGAQARTPLGTLTEAQRDALFDEVVKAVGYRVSVRSADGRILHGFEMMSKATKAWVGTVFWSNNLIGNDVEVVFNLVQLAHGEQERRNIKGWFDRTAMALQSRPAWNHSGKEESWYRAGFAFDAVMQFFDLLKPQLGALTLDSDRWPAAPPVEPAARPSVEPESSPALAPLATAKESTTDYLVETGPVETTEPPARSDLEATITLMLDHAQSASDESGRERTTVRKTKHQRFVDDQEFRRYVAALFEQQQRRCSITGLELQLLGKHDDSERIASLDRIDSDGHYEPSNLQIVCRFVNRWKRDDKDQDFRRLIGLLKTTWRA